MKVEQEVCPQCDEVLQGTCEVIPGVALMVKGPLGEWEYTGSTEQFWDGQMTEIDDKGLTRVQCHNGHTWWTQVNY